MPHDVFDLPLKPTPSDWLIGASIGQNTNQWTALAVLHRIESYNERPSRFECIHLKRFRGFRAPQRMVSEVRRMWPAIERRDLDRQIAHRRNIIGDGQGGLGINRWDRADIRVVADITGVGPFGIDPLKRAGYDPIGVALHAGDAASHPNPDTYRVPKRDIAGILSTLLGEGRLTVAATLKDVPTLQTELENFTTKVNIAAGTGSYAEEAWREGESDDLVLAVGIACWLGEQTPVPRIDPALISLWSDLPGVF
jgi:hypothetical protein